MYKYAANMGAVVAGDAENHGEVILALDSVQRAEGGLNSYNSTASF